MKITCHACDAKYTIADEKVTGRTVKIKCKKCGATIVVAADPSAAGGGAVTGAPGYAEPQMAAGEDDGMMATRVAGQDGAPGSVTAPEWTVSLAGEEERQMSQLQLAEEMQRGTVTGDTYVWRDGMPDWLAVSQVPELAALLARAAPGAAPGGYAAPAAQAAPHYQEEPQLGLAGTMVMTESPLMGASPAAAAPRPAAGAPAAFAAPAPAAAASPSLSPVNQPTAARRANRATGPTVDVFQQAAAENQPAAREPEKARPKPPTPAGRLGERNENSVLFSLSALTATENAAAKSGPADDAIVDFGLGGGSGGGRNGRSSMDDLMNLGGGGIGGGPMLAPPPLLAPVVEPPPAPAPMPVAASAAPAGMGMGMGAASYAPQSAPPKSKTGLIIGIVAAVLVVGGVGAVFALGGSGDPSGQTAGTTTAASSGPTTTAAAASTPSVTSAPSTTETPTSPDAPAGSNAVASNDTKGQSSGSGAGTSTKPGPLTTASASASTKPSAAPTTAPTAAPTASDTGTGAGRDFNKGAATTALSAAAGRARGCKTADGPTGSASVRVVFAPSGNVTSANVQGPPFAGTPVGGCIAAAFRGASVPPFDGSPVAVSKTVNIN